MHMSERASILAFTVNFHIRKQAAPYSTTIISEHPVKQWSRKDVESNERRRSNNAFTSYSIFCWLVVGGCCKDDSILGVGAMCVDTALEL